MRSQIQPRCRLKGVVRRACSWGKPKPSADSRPLPSIIGLAQPEGAHMERQEAIRWKLDALMIALAFLGGLPVRGQYCLAACDIQVKRAYIVNYVDEESPPRVGDPWVLVAAEYRVIGMPSAPVPIRLRCGAEQATPTQSVGPGEAWYVCWRFSTNIDGEVPWSVEFDPTTCWVMRTIRTTPPLDRTPRFPQTT